MRDITSALSSEIPEFIVKSALGCSMVVVLVLTPFLVYNFYLDNWLITTGVAIILSLCLTNVWFCYHNQYHLALNSYFLSPAAAITVATAIYIIGEPAAYWAFPTTLSFYFVLPENRGTFFNFFTSTILIILMWGISDIGTAMRFSAALIGTSLFVFLSMRQVYRLHRLLSEQVIKDPLTGLLNRTSLTESLQVAIAQKERAEVPTTIISFDIDHFKYINDNYGHAAGDKVLKDLGKQLKERIRETDKVFRTGGEEFLLLAYNTDKHQGMLIAEALRQYSEKNLSIAGKPITISFGVAELGTDMNETRWLKLADNNLYLAKHNGRNQVVG